MSETTPFPIRHWSEDDRPREKFQLKGKSALSDAELIAIIIGSGSSKESAVDLSKRILSSVHNNLNELSALSLEQLVAFKGIGPVKAIAISAAMELCRRRRESESRQLSKISSSRDVFELMQPVIGELPHEEFWLLYLNNSNKILHRHQLSKGGITGTVVDVRLAFKTALQFGATGIILCHNHPSGSLKPSDADKQITRKMRLAGDNLDIKVLDHVIVTETAYYSFSDEGLL
ncbi:RadC family protein [Flavobacterium silvaticum]|uniref:DNA repair protein RadC n=1 Tax=Flavobacterium silvaticum TaxID=1852020 RepID=A0A972FVR5_9FLAO|nr:DNA repair protein RadC [Flavobacterium silvaticum]NMH29603.1 DNA repair protein RadC [Flavobacterium silvaticum]